MYDFFDMNMYVVTMFARAVLSLLICVIAITGMGIAGTNNLKHNYFEFFYFFVVFMIEMPLTVFYIYLYCKQKGLRDLDPVNRIDCRGSCVALFLRLAWHFGMSLFIVIRINMEDFILKDKKWKEVRDLTIVVMTFTVMHMIGFLCALAYQPMEYIRKDS